MTLLTFPSNDASDIFSQFYFLIAPCFQSNLDFTVPIVSQLTKNFQKYLFWALLWTGLGNWKAYKVSCTFLVKITFFIIYKFSKCCTFKCTYFQNYFYLKMYCNFLNLLWLVAKVCITLLRSENGFSAFFFCLFSL